MPLSPNEIRDRALAFSREWADAASERAEAQTFWNEFFNVFGVSRRRLATFEEFVKPARRRWEKSDASGVGEPRGGFIDLFWRGRLIAEHKSRGENLDTAYRQALGYFESLPERDLPRYVIVSDFARIRLYDLDHGEQWDVPLKDLAKHIGHFTFIAGYEPRPVREEDPVNVKAAERLGRLHDQLKASGYAGRHLEVLLVRLLFCAFAEDTTIFDPPACFRDYIEIATAEDGSNLGAHLAELFQVLNTPVESRQKNLDERLAIFPYVNGKLFEEPLPIAAFDSGMRAALLDCCALDWSGISPAIFGALFQSVMDPEARRNLGAHYTSEQNILKLIGPLFLDDLRGEFARSKRNRNRLFELHKKLAALKFLDPACGCGNFLVIAYRELRLLEIDILKAERENDKQAVDVGQFITVNVDQFYGIECEEFPAQIAQVAMWLTDHQMNMAVSQEFGHYYRRLPLIHHATVRCANALALDWNEVVPAEEVDYVLGNPPFVGAKYMSSEQREDMRRVCGRVPSFGLLDYVCAWYVKAARYLRGDERLGRMLDLALPGTESPRDRVKVAFVSTNSISQGEQVGVLWSELFRLGVKIHFAHRTFRWRNQARGVAAVHCVIVGWALFDAGRKTIFDYADIAGDPHEIPAANINPYLVDAPDVLIGRRSAPLCDVPKMGIGNKPIDGGNYLFTDEEKADFVAAEPAAEKYFRPWLGADEFLYNYQRWVLWLGDCSPQELRSMPKVMARVEAVQEFRRASKSAPTRKLAATPTRFHVENMPGSDYLVIPKVSSERREYIPSGILPPKITCSDLLNLVSDADTYHFGVLSSAMHMAWVRYVAGRLESRYRYSSQIVYNNFLWPDNPSDARRRTVELAAQAVLDARAKFPESSLADLYDPAAMPPALRAAHTALDRAVDAAYGKRGFANDPARVAFLFDLYNRYTSELIPPPTKKKRLSTR